MKREFEPPHWVDFLIENLSPYHLAEEIRGDLYELYVDDIRQKGIRKARMNYIMNGIGFLAKSFFWKTAPDRNSNAFIMIKNYFKMASRTLLAYRSTTVINILGLIVGIASALVLFVVIRFELSFDAFHSNRDQIYRIVRVSGDDMSEFRAGISYPVPVAIKTEIPAVENVVSMEYMQGPSSMDIISADGSTVDQFMEMHGFVLIEPEFFNVFDFKDTGFKWISGNPVKSLSDPFSVVLTKTIAKKYFGDEDPLNRILRFYKKFDFKVTGVVEDFPQNSDFPFEVLLSYSSLHTMAGQERLNNWHAVNDTHCSYVVLSPGSTKEEIEKEIANVHAAHTSPELHKYRHYLLQKFSDVHYDARFRNFSGRTISHETLMGLGIVAVFLLLAGSINYINLSTAQSTLRAKEIGLRKVMGSNRRNLMMQFITETFVVVVIAGVLALALSEVLLYNLQSLLNINYSSYVFTDPYVLLCLLCIIICVTFFAGVYPSIIISRFNPLTALKFRFSNETLGGMSLRKMLVVLQFTITQILVVSTFIVVSQMRYFENVDMGFNREAIITSKINNIGVAKLETMQEQLRSQSFVSNVSLSFTSPSGLSRNRTYPNIGKPDAKAMEDFTAFEYEAIDPNYLELYQIKLVAGRNLSMSDSVGNILINKTLVKNLALGDHEDAIGQTLKFGDGKLVTVVGVVDDFYSNSLKEGVDNIVMLVDPKKYFTMSIKLATRNGQESMQEKIATIGKIWKANAPDFIFNYQFLDENIAAFYKQEQKYAQLFQIFSGVFLFIGCLGLYGLITFVVNRKGKEVAIRKVLGATLFNILLLFSREYIKLIIISFALAVPVAYYIVEGWLSAFANRIELQWWLFVLPGILVLIIALLVVSTKSFKAANANPVDKLKCE